jgi:uncharacterized repeat protein (TIGR03803 family)
MDKKGNLYGTTYYGGAYGYGTVFQVSASGAETVLYGFNPRHDELQGPYWRGITGSLSEGCSKSDSPMSGKRSANRAQSDLTD